MAANILEASCGGEDEDLLPCHDLALLLELTVHRVQAICSKSSGALSFKLFLAFAPLRPVLSPAEAGHWPSANSGFENRTRMWMGPLEPPRLPLTPWCKTGELQPGRDRTLSQSILVHPRLTRSLANMSALAQSR
jgi:hypothetical protein